MANDNKPKAIPASTWKGKERVKIDEIVQWVAANICMNVKPRDAPGPEAWQLLEDVRSDPEFRLKTFWSQMYMKMMPSKQQLEMQERFKDDGRTMLMIGELESERQEEIEDGKPIHSPGPEAVPGEPGVPAQDDREG